MNRTALLLAPAMLMTLSGCITFRTVDDGITRARIGETVAVGEHTIMPVRVIEDSRCPTTTQCVWAGRVRLAALVDGTERELASDAAASETPVRLVEIYPARRADTTYYPDEYRFGFTAPR